MRTRNSFRSFFKSVLFSILSFLILANCNLKSVDNACNPESKSYWETFFLSAGSSNLIPFCGPAPQSLSYPAAVFANGAPISLTPNITGGGLTFSITPPLPSGVVLDPRTGVISGSYIGYGGVDTMYQVKAFNSSGSVSYSLELILYGMAPLKTGQTSCWDGSGALIPCTGTKQDGELRNGILPSFTGPTNVSGSDYTTTDNLSGLIWKSCSEGTTGATCTGTWSNLDWAGSNTACSALNSGYAGRTDWRLASAKELAAMLNYDGTTPATYSSYFPNTNGSGHWTSTIYVPISATDRWYVSFTDGIIGETIQTNTNNVRCVSGPSLPSVLLKDNGDSTVTDVNTGLIWAQCSAGLSGSSCTGTATSLNWTNALLACNSLSLGGRVWRLPSVNELRSLTDLSLANPTVNTSYFPNTMSSNYWTSTTYTNPTEAWVIQFGSGNIVMNYTKGGTAYTRCVATGP
ncbi:DUF1566 domain-containing protein [Leptospira kmetyi]|uniref:Lcl C-terminal domain-containing protein n=1 Tax=Leptospira kmetyi TaxID=408139 RepID=UPI0010846D88|nr:DUF1566 domain-containing protein [Leptospira kmetyi]TGL72607.1 DUF1566 domain-containing protein [Leptospira kmetyi]